MSESRNRRGVRRSVDGSDAVTHEDREFMRRMEKRMPKLSLRNKADRSGREVQARLEGGYLRRFQKTEGTK